MFIPFTVLGLPTCFWWPYKNEKHDDLEGEDNMGSYKTVLFCHFSIFLESVPSDLLELQLLQLSFREGATAHPESAQKWDPCVALEAVRPRDSWRQQLAYGCLLCGTLSMCFTGVFVQRCYMICKPGFSTQETREMGMTFPKSWNPVSNLVYSTISWCFFHTEC